MHNTGCVLATRWEDLLCYSCQTPKNSWCCWRGHLVSPLTRSTEIALTPISFKDLQLPILTNFRTQPEVIDWSGVQREPPLANIQATHRCAVFTHRKATHPRQEHSSSPVLKHERATIGNKPESERIAFSSQVLPYQTKSINPPGNTIREITPACSKLRWPYRCKSRELALCSPDPRLTLNPVQGWLVFVPQSCMLTSVKLRLQVQCRLFSVCFQSWE